MPLLRFPSLPLALCASLASIAAGCGADSFSSAAGAAGASGSGGADASAGSGGGAGMDGGGGSGGSEDGGTNVDGSDADAGLDDAADADAATACDPNESPTSGIFVSPAAAPGGDGSAALPFSTIKAALDAAAGNVATVYLDQGTYPEPVDFAAKHAGIVVRGGFTRTGSVWKRDCSADARAKTVIASPAAVGVHVGQLATPSGLRTLSVFSKATGSSVDGKAGESCYGVAVTGAGTHFTLHDVAVTAGTGGAGGLASAIVAADKVACGDLVTSCADGAKGADGASAGATPAGTFNPGGYQPGNGGDAHPGDTGHNGTPGTSGVSASCKYPGCSGGGGLCATLFCGNVGSQQTVTAGPGTCGCGGKGGDGGGGGFGGGASVAVFVAGAGAQVDVVSSALVAKNGGNGSQGVPGQGGASGTAGVQGASASCPGACESVKKSNDQCNCEQPSSTTLAGGAAGGNGGHGGLGGDGGGGSGGPSYAVVRVGGALVSAVASSTTPGQGGSGANAPNGGSGAELVVP